jgi:hypothetical protein
VIETANTRSGVRGSFDRREVGIHAVTAANVAGPAGFYATMKVANPAANVGVVVEGAGWNYRDGWDKAVLPNAPFDFIELHWYAQDSGSESDDYLLNQAPAAFTAMINTVRIELSATQGSGYACMPFNPDDTNPQTVDLEIDKPGRQSFAASALIYGKNQYDDSQNNIWTGPVSQSLGIVGTTVPVSLPPWSMVIVKLQ